MEKKTKTIEMNNDAIKEAKVDGNPEKITYEQLNQAAGSLFEENKKLKAELQNMYAKFQEVNNAYLFASLDALFKVLDPKNEFDEYSRTITRSKIHELLLKDIMPNENDDNGCVCPECECESVENK